LDFILIWAMTCACGIGKVVFDVGFFFGSHIFAAISTIEMDFCLHWRDLVVSRWSDIVWKMEVLQKFKF
jgi:hypothetical protein